MTPKLYEQVKTAGPEYDFPELSHLAIASSNRLWTTLFCSLCTSLVVGLCAIVAVPAQYKSTSSVRILQRENYLLTTQQSRSEDAEFVRAQPALVTLEQTLSQALLNEPLNSFVVKNSLPASVDWLRNQIKAEIATGSDTMTIVASSRTAEIASLVSQSVAQAYLAHITSQLRFSRVRRVRELETTAAEANEKLMQQWKLLQSKANATGSGSSQSLSISEQLKIQNLRDNSQRLRSLRFQRSQVELQLGTERKARVPMQISPEDEINSAIDQHPEVIALREQIRQCEIKVQKIQEIVKNKDAPQLVRLQNEKQYYSTAENQLRDKIKATELKRLKNLVTESSPSVKSKELEVQLQLIDQELKQLGETSAQLESSIAAANGSNGVELEIIRHEIDRQEKLADQLWKTIQELRIEERAEPRVALLSIPNSEVKLNRSTQLKTVAAASLIGCVIAILCVGYLEWASCIVRSPYDILKRARMRAFGFTGRKRRATVKNIASGADEIAAQLLLFTCENGKIPITFVSSPSDREPRSAVSVALAISLTQVGKSTLLIAFDRCNELRSDGDKTSSRGQDLIRGLSHPVAYSSLYGFDYVKMGSNQDNRNWTASKSLPMILKEVRNRYEAIVLLGPAVLTCPESVVLAKMAELTLLVGVMGASRSDELSASREQLESARSAILGTLVTPAFSDTLTLTPPVHDVHRKEHVAVPKEVDEVAILAELTGLTGLTGVTEMQGQIKQIDPAAAVKAPHKFKLSKQPIPRPQHRTTE